VVLAVVFGFFSLRPDLSPCRRPGENQLSSAESWWVGRLRPRSPEGRRYISWHAGSVVIVESERCAAEGPTESNREMTAMSFTTLDFDSAYQRVRAQAR
jgi:hypothetical protein